MDNDDRPSWNEYFQQIAEAVAERSTCPRMRVGCVIVKDNRILCTGYNGAVSGYPHCDDVGCKLENNHCVRTIHAEANALVQAAKFGIPVAGANAYITHYPCDYCAKLLQNAGLTWSTPRGFIASPRPS